MDRRFISACFIVAALLAVAPSPATPHEPERVSETKDCTVYITRTGSKYHRSGCSSLRYSRVAVTRSQAIAAGYTACKRCGGSDCEAN